MIQKRIQLRDSNHPSIFGYILVEMQRNAMKRMTREIIDGNVYNLSIYNRDIIVRKIESRSGRAIVNESRQHPRGGSYGAVPLAIGL